jgi:Na+/proline symporter
MTAMLDRLHAAGADSATALFPDFSHGLTSTLVWTLPVLTFVVYLGLQWWAAWYPGAEPGGGGYIAQRIFSAKDERHGLLSVLWFNIAHYALRPWPWIITGLAVIVLYPGLGKEEAERHYIVVLTQHVPHALLGVAIAGFLAAFMSTIATQLNWGASYLVADFYRRFVRRNASERHYVNVSRLATVLLVVASAWVSVNLSSITGGWQVVLEIGAGTGAVYLLRWYWWRINAWSEISAMACSLVTTAVLNSSRLWSAVLGRPTLFTDPNSAVVFAKTALTTTVITTVAWVAVTLFTKPEDQAVLLKFYRKVRPDVRGWQPVARRAPEVAPTRDLGRNLIAWAFGCAMIYLALFGTGKLLLHQPGLGVALLVGSAVCAVLLYADLSRRGWAAETAVETAQAAK